jgi:SPP1 gp7 family putative phage head morphogenesis protein
MDPNEKNKTAVMTEKNGDKIIRIRFPYDLDLLYKIRSLPGRRYYKEDLSWSAPIHPESLKYLIDWGFTLDNNLKLFLQKAQIKEDDITNNGIGGLNGKLFKYQSKAVVFIENNKGRALINFEMGLGKTIIALAWLQLHPDKRPAIIVVPSSMKLKWKREAELWMSYPKVDVVFGKSTLLDLSGEIIIINYDILSNWVNKLKTLNIQVLILDEVHYIRDNSAAQTKAVKKLGKNIPHVICLTGISVVARPFEAFNAIKLIRPDLVPGYAEYSRRYCDSKPDYFGWEAYGPSPSKTSFTFSRSKEKLTDFMIWLEEQVKKGLIEIIEFDQVGKGIEAEWTNKYIADSYKRKEMRSRYELMNAGIKVPSKDDTKGNFINMSTPFHIDRVGLLFTRVFSNLPGITDAMDAVISRILAQGMADGDGPALLARKMEAAINGTGLGDLGITDAFISDTINRSISTKRRALMLAHTEMMRAYHKATIQDYRNWKKEGVTVQAEWSTVGDNRVCDICKALEGKLFSLDEIEDMIPLHPECRCIALPYIEDLKKYYSEPEKKKDLLGLREGINTEYSNLNGLYELLTGTIMIRRLKKDVLNDLPSKIHSFVPLELDNVKEYNLAEKDFITFLKQKLDSEVVVKEQTSFVQPFIEILTMLVLKGKLGQIIDWVRNFLEVGSKLVVFTPRSFVIDALIHVFSKISVKIERSISIVEKQRVVMDFQTNPNVRLIVVDQEVEDGFKLPTASNVAFFELPWSLGLFSHIDDICSMTSMSDSINIFYLIAAGTIEERIVNLIEWKEKAHYISYNSIESEITTLLNKLITEYRNMKL